MHCCIIKHATALFHTTTTRRSCRWARRAFSGKWGVSKTSAASGFYFASPDAFRFHPNTFGFQLAAGGADVASARAAHRRVIAGPLQYPRKGVHPLFGRCFKAAARPRIEGDQVYLAGNAGENFRQFM